MFVVAVATCLLIGLLVEIYLEAPLEILMHYLEL